MTWTATLIGVAARDACAGERVALALQVGLLVLHPAGTTPGAWRRLTGRTHPEVTAMHRAYRQRRGKRGWRR